MRRAVTVVLIVGALIPPLVVRAQQRGPYTLRGIVVDAGTGAPVWRPLRAVVAVCR